MPNHVKAENPFLTLDQEMQRARYKFPANKLLAAALVEELGEWARSGDVTQPGNEEVLQVACVAMRIYTEGCTEPTQGERSLLGWLRHLEFQARHVLEEQTGSR